MESPQSRTVPADEYSQRPEPRKSLLAWWGLIPVAILIVIEVLYGWPKAKINATAPDAVVSYFIGHILGGLLFAFAAAWVSYRATRRSQLAATIAFSITIGLACLGILRPGLNQLPSGVRTTASTTAKLESFDEFQFEVPAGWMRVQPDQNKTLAVLVRSNTSQKSVDAMIKVDSGKPSQPTARDLAQALAGKDGRVFSDPVNVDGIDGAKVEIPSKDLSRPRFAVIVFRDQKAYLIMAAAVEGIDISEAFDHVIKTWRWNITR